MMELMVVLAIAAAVLVLGAPNFNQFRLNNRLTNAANDMLSATTLARTEAIKRQVAVAACPSSDPLGDEPTCVTNATSGWIVFEDTDGNCKRGLTEAVIDARKLENDNTANLLRVKYDGDCLSFAPTGFRQAIAGTTPVNHILMCDNRGITKAAGTTLSAARGIIISPTGRARVTRDVSGGLADDITKWGPAGVCP